MQNVYYGNETGKAALQARTHPILGGNLPDAVTLHISAHFGIVDILTVTSTGYSAEPSEFVSQLALG